MMTNNSDKEVYRDIWHKVYRIVALILLVSMFLNLVGTLLMMLGVPMDKFIVLFFLPVPRIGFFY